MVLQQTSLNELVLDILNLPDQIEITSPTWHLLVDLFVLVHNSDLLSEVLLVKLPVDLDEISSVVELLVVGEDVGL